jgi:hypothetical protein
MYLMKHRTFSKLIIFQAFITFLNTKASGGWENPLVASLETDITVVFCDRSEFRDLDVKFEGAAVAVAFVRLEFWSGAWFHHWRNGPGRFAQLNMEWHSQERSRSFFPSENEQCTVAFVEAEFLINLCGF